MYSLKDIDITNKMAIIEYVGYALKNEHLNGEYERYIDIALEVENIKELIKLSLGYLYSANGKL